MATFDVINLEGKKVSSIELDDAVFSAPVKMGLLYEVVKWQQARKRQGTHAVKSRSFVRGGGAKPWRQKGTGRARQGSIRASQWVGGGTANGPVPHSYDYALPKKMRKGAIRSALSLRAKEGKLLIVDSLQLDEIKTKKAREALEEKLGLKEALIVEKRDNDAWTKSVRNLPTFQTLDPGGLNARDILRYDTLILTQDVAKEVQERLR
ncbi:MAG: 50S ribosomal protein L4 [Deltaproteobacteria bacterium]|nr:MAG: 50S ribosomal protein L4 [Deltaproteobacteria bacterium]